jgi:hypothetical protein
LDQSKQVYGFGNQKYHQTFNEGGIMRGSVMVFLLSLILAASFSLPAVSATPGTISFQGILLGSDGNPVPDNTYSISFSIWDDSTGGTQYWTETQSVPTSSGGANVAMGDVNVIDYDGFPENAYLEIQISGDSPMTPRIRLTNAPYSMTSNRVSGDVLTAPGSIKIGVDPSPFKYAELSGTAIESKLSLGGQEGEDLLRLKSDDNGSNMHMGDQFFDVFVEVDIDASHENGHMTISNIGSSGEDGVSVEVESTKSEILMFENNSSTTDSSGARIGVNNDESVINLGIDSDDLGVVSSANSSAGRFGSSHTSGYNSSTGPSSEARIKADSGGAGFYAVDSFFDVEYRADYSASDSAAESRIRADDSSNSFEKAEKATPNLLQATCSGAHENGHSFIIQSIDNQGSSGEYKWMPDIGDEVVVGFNADSSGGQLHLSNIGSSGEDGVSIDVGGTASFIGIEHEDIGGDTASLGITADASGGHLVVSNIGSSGEDGVSIDVGGTASFIGIEHEDIGGDTASLGITADASGGHLVVSNIGSSGEDGVSATADSNGSRLALYTQPTGDVQTEILSLSLVSSEPLMAVRNPYGSSTDPLVMDYTYDALGNITRTSRSFDPFAPGDSSMTSASGFHVFDGSYELHFDTNGLTFSDAAGPTCSVQRLGTITLKRGIVAAQDATSSVGIGAPSTGYKLYVDGDVCITGSYLSCSDLRFKENINNIDCPIDKVKRLRGVNFDWRKDEFPERNFSDDPQLGMIAQEVMEVAPEAVSQDNEGYYSVDYSRLVPILVEAVKEQQKTIESMQKKLEENDNLRAQLNELKSVVQQLAADNGLSKETVTETTSY